MSDAPDQGLPGDGDTETPPDGGNGGDGGTEGPEEPEPGEPGAQAPPLATDPILEDHIDVPNLGGPVGAGQVNAIGTAVAAAAAAQEEEQST
jgi:hypothetical protein